jgi:ABC-type sugar transport system substrate-binding protein
MSRAKLAPPRDGGRSRAPRFSFLALALTVAASAVGVAACGSSDSTSSSSSSGSSGGKAASVAGKDVAVVSVADSNPWAAVFNRVVKQRLTAEGAKVTVTGDTDPAGQVQLLNQAVSETPDLIILEALDSKAVAPAIAKAKAQHIPVLNADGKADPSVADGLHQVLSDNVALGEFAAQNIVEGLQKQGKKSGRIGAITGTAAMLLTQERMQGFKKVLAQHPSYKLVFDQDGNWDPVKSGEIAKRMFAKYGKGGLDAAYGMADYMAVPIITAAKQAGIPVGLKNDGLIVTGGNCFKIGIQAISAGEMYGTATEDPGTLAEHVAAYGSKLLKGADVPLTQTVKEARVSPQTLKQYTPQCTKA